MSNNWDGNWWKDIAAAATIALIVGSILLAVGLGRASRENKLLERKINLLEREKQHTRVIEQCNRINLLSCIACHDFPAYVIDVQPEIWEE